MMRFSLFVVVFLTRTLGSVAFILGVPPQSANNHGVSRTRQEYLKNPSTRTLQQYTTSTTLFENLLWDRMEIEEDEEKMWYCLNCVAGMEIDLLRQCRQRCEGMDDVEKFVVPMMTAVRSHGANRMVKDTKVKYQGYVFAKLRLCPETYETIQELDLCRSWMGTINFKGHKKLPPSPVCLNEEEIEKFRLEECEAEEKSDDEEIDEEGVILDIKEEPEVDPELEETVQNVYLGLRVGDMVKITAKNNFFNEDAIVRRLKGGQLFLRFYTYGSMYEEWMDPSDVRKLSDEEVIRGLSGPQQPITQRDIDGPSLGEDRGQFQDDRSRRNMVSNFGRNQNRREGRNAERDDRGTAQEARRNDDNWNWYKDNERQSRGGYTDGEYEMQGSAEQESRRDNKSAQGDVDGQWGRTTQRQNRREKRKTEADDWSGFITSPGGKEQPSQAETDDFFASLMTDLSNDLASDNQDTSNSQSKAKATDLSSNDDDFFASLISEIEAEDSPKTSSEPKREVKDEDDFFASIMQEVENDVDAKSSKQKESSIDDDFFDSLVEDIRVDEKSEYVSNEFLESMLEEDHPKKVSAADELDDFFLELGLLDDENPSPLSPASIGDKKVENKEATSNSIFDSSDEALITNPESGLENGWSQSGQQESTKSTSKIDGSDLGKRTVPELKEMLRERGLKVSGKKAELIERLTTSA